MKIKNLLTLGVFGLMSLATVQAQNKIAPRCISQEMLQQYPATDARMEQQIQAYISQRQHLKTNGVVTKIPTVIHVVTEKGCGGISKAQILNGLEIVNQDFRRQNADTINTRAIFKPYAVDTEIEFVLARLDPNGQPTDGINRVTSHLTKGSGNWTDLHNAVPPWDPNKYFNIWLVDKIYNSGASDPSASINGIIIGNAIFPNSSIPLNFYGPVLTHYTWGKQGAVSGSTATYDGRYATHFIAHSLYLHHLEGGNCTDSDMVFDTPPANLYLVSAPFPCNYTQNTCTNDMSFGWPMDMPDQIENFMSYTDLNCKNMFTRGQKLRMEATLATFPHLQNLTSPANAFNTGIDPTANVGPTSPKPYFCLSSSRICAGNSISFTDQSFNADATSWNWSFPGGSPATSTAQNPVITYSIPGDYDVVLTTSNSVGGPISKTWTKHVKVVPVSNLIQLSAPNYYVEGFEEPGFPMSATANRSWEITTTDIRPTPVNWTRVGNAYSNITNGQGVNSLKLESGYIPTGTVSTLITPNFSIQNGFSGHVFMEMAYAKRNSTPLEELRVYVSKDCGVTWQGPVTTLIGNALVTNGGTTVPGNFVPLANDWRIQDIITPGNMSLIANSPHVMFKIETVSNNGGNLYIDNFSIGWVLGTNEDLAAKHSIKVFPNPLTPVTGITFELKTAAKASVKITDMLGKTIFAGSESSFSAGKHTISLAEKASGLSAGNYLVQLKLDGKTYNSKLLVQ